MQNHRRALAPMLVAAAALLTMTELPDLARSSGEFAAGDRQTALDLRAFAASEGDRYDIYAELAARAPGADYVIDPAIIGGRRGMLPELLHALAEAGSVTVMPLDIVVPPGEERSGPLRVLPVDDPPKRLLIVPTEAGLAIVDDRLVPDQVAPTPVGPGVPLLSDGPSSGSVRTWFGWEAVLLTALTVIGAAMVPRRMSTVLRMAAGLPIGAAMLVVGGAALLLLGLTPTPAMMAIALVIGAALSIRSRRVEWILLVPVFGLALLVVAVTRADGIVAVTPDSLSYLATAALVAAGDVSPALLSPELFAKRMLGVSLLHAPAAWSGVPALTALGPLLALASVGATGWLVHEESRPTIGPGPAVVLAGAAAATLLSVERVLAAAIYVNSHMFIATTLIVAVALWRSGIRRTIAWGHPVGLLLGSIVIARPEGAIVVVVMLAAMTSRGPEVSSTEERAAWWWVGGATALAHGVVGWSFFIAGRPLPGPTLAMLLLVPFLFAMPELRAAVGPARTQSLVRWAGAGVMASTAALVLLDVGRFGRGSTIVAANLLGGSGGWGRAGALLLIALVVGAVGTWRSELEGIGIATLAFLPLMVIIGELADQGPRLGPGDSLNRMLLHVLPLAVAIGAIGLMNLATGRVRWRGSVETEVFETPGATSEVEGGRTATDILLLQGGGILLVLLAVLPGPLGLERPLDDPIPIVTPAQLIGQEPAGELVAGTELVHALRFRPGELVDTDGLCIELLLATYGERTNSGILEVVLRHRSGAGPSVSERIDMAVVQDNAFHRVCFSDPAAAGIDSIGGDDWVLVLRSVAGEPGAVITVWLTKDLSRGALMGPSGSDAALMHRLVGPIAKRLPRTAAAVGLLLTTAVAVRFVCPRSLAYWRPRTRLRW